jgi:hypothetical protein
MSGFVAYNMLVDVAERFVRAAHGRAYTVIASSTYATAESATRTSVLISVSVLHYSLLLPFSAASSVWMVYLVSLVRLLV